MKYLISSGAFSTYLEGLTAQRARFENATVFKTLHPSEIQRDVLIESGIITSENRYPIPALVTLMAHITLWQEAAIRNAAITVISEKAQLASQFDIATDAILAQAPQCDAIFWGVDTHGPIIVQLDGMPAMTGFFHGRCCLGTDHPDGLGSEARMLARLYSFTGLTCYTVFPEGARNLLHRLLPIGGDVAHLALPSSQEPHRLSREPRLNTGLDVELSRCARTLDLRLAFPPLAYYDPNWGTQNDVIGLRPDLHRAFAPLYGV